MSVNSFMCAFPSSLYLNCCIIIQNLTDQSRTEPQTRALSFEWTTPVVSFSMFSGSFSGSVANICDLNSRQMREKRLTFMI